MVQEASGAPRLRVAGRRWQFQDLVPRMPERYRLVDNLPYRRSGRIIGSQDARTIYGGDLFSSLKHGFYGLPDDALKNVRWMPWVLLLSKADGTAF
jgi:hypothetical protein